MPAGRLLSGLRSMPVPCAQAPSSKPAVYSQASRSMSRDHIPTGTRRPAVYAMCLASRCMNRVLDSEVRLRTHMRCVRFPKSQARTVVTSGAFEWLVNAEIR